LEGSSLTTALIVTAPPAPTLELLAELETEMAFSVMVTKPDLLPSATEVPVIFTVTLLLGGAPGALYVTDIPVALIRTPEPVPDAGDMLQVTPLLEVSLFTCAVIVIWLPASAVVADADTETVMFCGIEVPPPPHATIMAARANAGDSTARRVARAIMPPRARCFPISAIPGPGR
jgi:hypothetical protein